MMTKAAQPAASRARLPPILAPYQPRRRSSSPACLTCLDNWVYSLQPPLAADTGRADGSCSRRMQAPACGPLWLLVTRSGGSSWPEAAEQPAAALGGTVLATQ